MRTIAKWILLASCGLGSASCAPAADPIEGTAADPAAVAPSAVDTPGVAARPAHNEAAVRPRPPRR